VDALHYRESVASRASDSSGSVDTIELDSGDTTGLAAVVTAEDKGLVAVATVEDKDLAAVATASDKGLAAVATADDKTWPDEDGCSENISSNSVNSFIRPVSTYFLPSETGSQS